jgi:hypothetical protein
MQRRAASLVLDDGVPSPVRNPGRFRSGKRRNQERIVPAGALRRARRVPSEGIPGEQYGKRAVVSHIFTSWNQLTGWLRRVDHVRRAA